MPYEVKFVWFSRQKVNEAEKELAEKLNEGWSIVGTSAINISLGSEQQDTWAVAMEQAMEQATGNVHPDGYVILRRSVGRGAGAV